MIYDIWYAIIYLTAIGLTPGGSSSVHIYTKNTQNDQNKQYIEQHKKYTAQTKIMNYFEIKPTLRNC